MAGRGVTGQPRSRIRKQSDMKPSTGVMLLLLFFYAQAVAGAGFYRWVDDQGRVHFGDRAPPGKGQALELPVPPPVAPAQRQRDAQRRETRRRLRDRYDQERQASERERQQAQQRAAARERRCSKARRRLEAYERSNAMYEPLPDGSRRYLSATERRSRIERARRDGGQWCEEQ